MAFGMVLDVLDGVVARATGTTSAIGKELDALADLVTFGVAPAILTVAFAGSFLRVDGPGPYALRVLAVVVACGYVVCAGYRLARFKQDSDVAPTNPPTGPGRYFAGMPSTPAAGMAVVVVALAHGRPPATNAASLAYLALVAVLGALMVSRWRYRSQRDVFVRPRTALAAVLMGLTAIGLVLATTWTLFVVAGTYMVTGIVARVTSVELGRTRGG
jgi:CDP-diacylglycerol--serine O-phosphatidyltransferase